MSKAALLSLLLVGFAPIGALAEVTALPATAYDSFFDISLATTAQEKCPGAVVDSDALNTAIFAALQGLSGAGTDPVEAVQHLETEAGMAELTVREAALRSRHGVEAEGDAALCAAIMAESRTRAGLAALVAFP